MPIKLHSIFILILFLSPRFHYAQSSLIPLNYLESHGLEKEIYKVGLHSSFRPVILIKPGQIKLDSGLVRKYKNPFSKKFPATIWDHTFNDHHLTLDTLNFSFSANLIINPEKGKSLSGQKKIYTNSRGVRVEGRIGKKISFVSLFSENQGAFPVYVDNFVKKFEVIPGQGRRRAFGNNYDYGYAEGYVSFVPDSVFSFQFGSGKNFIGDGYRSLILSDNTYNYPFLRINTEVWKIRYTNLFTQFQDLMLPHYYSTGFVKKYGSFHYLSINLTKRIELSLFEGIIWEASDSNGYRGFEISYLNPVIFYRPVEFGLGSPDNAVLGANFNYKITPENIFYAQLFIDDMSITTLKKGSGFFQNKNGWQLGLKSYQLLNIPNLFGQLEYNQVRPYTYAHKIPVQNYAHYNQPLAHPLGANFREGLVFLEYLYKDYLISFKGFKAVLGKDTSGLSFGNDIFRSDYEAVKGSIYTYNNFIGAGLRTNLITYEVKASWILNHVNNMNIFISFRQRQEINSRERIKENFILGGLSFNLRNKNYDF